MTGAFESVDEVLVFDKDRANRGINVFLEKTSDENRREAVKEGSGLLHGGGVFVCDEIR